MLAIVIGVPPFPEIARRDPDRQDGQPPARGGRSSCCAWRCWPAGGSTTWPRARAAAPASCVLGARAGDCSLLPVLVLAARGQLSAGLLGRALEIACGLRLARPAAARATSITAIRMAVADRLARLHGPGARLLLAARLRCRLAATRVRGAGAGAGRPADLFKAGMGATPAIDTDAGHPARPRPAIEYLQSRRPNRFVGLERPLGPSPLSPTWRCAGTSTTPAATTSRWRSATTRSGGAPCCDGGPTDTPTTRRGSRARALPAFRLLSVTDIAQDPDEPPVRDPALPLAYDGRDLRVYANPRALPARRRGRRPARGAGRGRPARRPCSTRASTAGARWSPAGRCRDCATAPGPGPAGTARGSSAYEPERVVVEASARRPGELVLTDLHYPGWKVDARRRARRPAPGELPAARHDAARRAGTASSSATSRCRWRLGWIVSLAGR